MLKGLLPVASNTELPKQTEVVIIGGGIIGACAALMLAEKGVPVCLIEKGEIGAEQSGRNWGWVHKMGRVEADIDLSILSERIWETLDIRAGYKTGYRKNGGVYPCDTRAELDEWAKWTRDVAEPRGVDSIILTRAQLEALLPGGKRDFVGGLYTKSDGCAEPFWAAPAIAKGAQDKGAKVFTNCAARGIETSGGVVSGVVTEKGRVGCKTVVLATGAWTRLMCKHLGLDFPQLRLLASVMQTKPLGGAPDICVGASDFSFRKRADGGYTVARRNANTTFLTPDHFRYFLHFLPTLREKRKLVQVRGGLSFFKAWRDGMDWSEDQQTVFERTRILEHAPAGKTLASGVANLKAAYPVFENLKPEQTWAGFIEGTPDALPAISPVKRVPGLVIASGFSGQGFGPGPGAGQVIADIVTGATPSVDISNYTFDRFDAA